ncbi:surface-adhesin E family protein [Faecalibacter bovis]|uniref:Surface-adhesin protein E-like domain-containing protein n=1 Tax=Faecalibacter bovis TaxID=2898187 RepID=A0ABX7XC84_9FLAO|nr:surface-adhesin E family protein [Faecalibacter bovis]QTV05523.1 hypothetical protein J9309_12240 [Faecalibacter bovis]
MNNLYIVAVMLISGFVNAQEWVEIGETSEGNTYFMQDKYSKVFASNNRKVWTKYFSDEFELSNNVKIKNGYALILHEYNCEENTSMMHEMIFYNSEGKIVERHKVEIYNREWTDAVPDSLGEIMMEYACSL